MAERSLDELRELVVSGQRRTVYAYCKRDGSVPAIAFLRDLDNAIEARYLIRFKKLCDAGLLRGDDHHPLDSKKDKEAKGLSEFKDISSKTRILAFSTGEPAIIVLSHGFKKKENKLSMGEILTAKRNRDEYLERKKQIDESQSKQDKHGETDKRSRRKKRAG